MKVERFTTHIGARVTGLDLAKVTLNDRQSLRDLLEEHLVLAFEGQSLDIDEFQNFGEVIGDLDVTPIVPGVRGPEDPVHIIEVPAGTRRGSYADQWHSDVPYIEKPPYASILMPIQLPSIGGDTNWASMYAAYENLAAPLQRLADELYVVQGVASNKIVAEHVHPLVRVNPRNGRRGLYINGTFTQDFVGVSREESKQLMAMFIALSTQPDIVFRYRWKPHSVIIWDNRFTQHYAVSDYNEPRRMHRMTVKGEEVFGLRPREEMPEANMQPYRATAVPQPELA
jgi:taurine dioxygenase